MAGLNNFMGDKMESFNSAVGLGVDKAILYIQTSNNENLGTQSIANQTSKVLKESGSNILGSALMGGTGKLDAGHFYKLKVQYNPASIRLTSYADAVKVHSHQVLQSDEIYIQNTRPPSVTMDVNLIFDDVSPADSFTGTLLTPSVNSTLEYVGKAFNLVSHSVATPTNALVGMLMRENTRIVCFQWADMAFVGEVMAVDARYTMFNRSGEPVRSTVSLNILQKVESNDAISYWGDAFDKFWV